MSEWTSYYKAPPAKMVPIMMGPQGARRLVMEYLKSVLPGLVDKLSIVWSLGSDVGWIKPANYYDYEMVRIKPMEIPLVCVTCPNTARLVPQGMDDVTGEPVFTSDYNMRVYYFLASEGVESTVRVRDYYATMIRIALAAQSGGMAIGNENCIDREYQAMVQIETLREEYSEVEKSSTNTAMYIASGFTTFTLSATERASAKTEDDLVSPPEEGWGFDVDAYGTRGPNREEFAFPETA